jgi:hypothetical protein
MFDECRDIETIGDIKTEGASCVMSIIDNDVFMKCLQHQNFDNNALLSISKIKKNTIMTDCVRYSSDYNNCWFVQYINTRDVIYCSNITHVRDLTFRNKKNKTYLDLSVIGNHNKFWNMFDRSNVYDNEDKTKQTLDDYIKSHKSYISIDHNYTDSCNDLYYSCTQYVPYSIGYIVRISFIDLITKYMDIIISNTIVNLEFNTIKHIISPTAKHSDIPLQIPYMTAI